MRSKWWCGAVTGYNKKKQKPQEIMNRDGYGQERGCGRIKLKWYYHIRKSDESIRWINSITDCSPIGSRKWGRLRRPW